MSVFFKGGVGMNKPIITISRAYGSGGHEIGKKLAETLQIPFYDNEQISILAQKEGISKELLADAEKIGSNNILFSLSKLGNSTEVYGMPLSERIYDVQKKVIQEIAYKGPCVIVGRCADYILKDFENCVHIFITASLPTRVRRAVSEYHLTEENPEKKVLKADKSRELYYNYHTGQKWGEASNYDIVINTDRTGLDNAVTIIEAYAYMQNEQAPIKPVPKF